MNRLDPGRGLYAVAYARGHEWHSKLRPPYLAGERRESVIGPPAEAGRARQARHRVGQFGALSCLPQRPQIRSRIGSNQPKGRSLIQRQGVTRCTVSRARSRPPASDAPTRTHLAWPPGTVTRVPAPGAAARDR
jgi:hypothetical protein